MGTGQLAPGNSPQYSLGGMGAKWQKLVPSGPETQSEAGRASDSSGTRQEAVNMYVKHMEMRANSGARGDKY